MNNIENIIKENPNDFELGKKIRETAFSSDELDYKDMYLRLAADFDNYKKRVYKEKGELVLQTKTSILETILDIDSDIAIASKHIKDDGINLIISKLEKFLLSHGIETIQTSTYDENVHEVIGIIEQTDKGIVNVAQKGYKIGDKIIRHPKIILSK